MSINIEETVSLMVEDTKLQAALDDAGKSIFERQFEEAFTAPGGPVTYWKAIEEQWKEVTGGAPIPAKYRSSKSVILKAWNKNSELSSYIVDGKTMRKSALEMALNEKRPLTRAQAEANIIKYYRNQILKVVAPEDKMLVRQQVLEYINNEVY